MNQIFHLLNLIVLYSILALTMNMLLGYLGILYLAHPAIYGIGAYTFAILTTTMDIDVMLALFAGGGASLVAGLILALPALRLKSHYIGMATLAFLIIMNGLFINLRDVTRGALGIRGIPRPTVFGHVLNTNGSFLIFNIVIAAIIALILYKILHSPFSKVIEAIREDETAVKTLGKNVYRYKFQIFALTSFIGGIGGGLLASYLQYISPWNFSTDELIVILAMVIIGGMASYKGSIVGAIIITLLPELLRFLPYEPEIVGPLRYAAYGVLIILFMIYRPRGLFGKRTNLFAQ